MVKQKRPSPEESKEGFSSDNLDSLKQKVTKLYGDGTMRRASEKPPWKHIPTGIFTLDMALHGGFPRSQMTLCYGREASGKSTLALKVIGNAQKMLPEEDAVLVDIEGTFDETWAIRNGVDIDKLWLVQPSTGEQALDIADEIIRSPNISVVAVDSLAALVPYKEIEKSTEDDLPGLQARLIGKFVRKVVSGFIEQRKLGYIPTLILLNQWRMRIGVFRGDPRVLPGGMAQHFAAFSKIEILNKEHEGTDALDQSTIDYNQHSFKIAKNKEGTSIRHGEFTMIRNPSHELGQGFIDDGRTVATWAKKLDLVTGSGAGGYYIDGLDQKFRVLDDMTEYFYKNPEFYDEFKKRLISLYRANNGLRPDGWL